ncbi:hypothetical protein LMG31506_06433 [Cupriavidus yeoncheonensis]|uniref:Phage capsid-like C-terminal domain-containing protein n=1 Tax=Cupriavidus yeoncheonensis TaxID=1462994 RepID=A0A916J424_9BURK|nr:phage major capsid protein [Cupriavidus yeoncheonensis]CAG2158610.1 hypothetical protein LMG31506_06433 [Cupriavidus yeoncheonensis]
MDISEIKRALDEGYQPIRERLDKSETRLTELEQGFAGRTHSASLVVPDDGSRVAKALVDGFDRQAFQKHGRQRVEVDGSLMSKAAPITTAHAGTVSSVGGVPALAPRFDLRSVLRVIKVTSSTVQYVRAGTFTNAAAVVPEGQTKPQSDVVFGLIDAKPQTIAHWFSTSRQVLDDNQQLQLALETFGKAGVGIKEEAFALTGDATTGNAGLLTDAPAAAALPPRGRIDVAPIEFEPWGR